MTELEDSDFRTAEFFDVLVQPYLSLGEHWRHLPDHMGGPVWPDWGSRTFERFNRDGAVADVEPPHETPGLPVPELKGTWWWLGPHTANFGHQIADFSTRIAGSLLADPDARFLVASRVAGYSKLTPLVAEILMLFGVEAERVHVVTHGLRVQHLRVVEQGEQLWESGPSDRYLQAIRRTLRLPIPLEKRDSILYVSRRGFQEKVGKTRPVGSLAGDGYLAALVERAGGRVIEPENMTLREQLTAYMTHRRVVFVEGSAYHGLQLLPQASVGEVDVLLRRRGSRASRRLLELRTARFSCVDTFGSLVSVYDSEVLARSSTFQAGALIVPDEKKLLAFLESLGNGLAARFDRNEYRRVLIAETTSYLEVCLRMSTEPHLRENLAKSLKRAGLAELLPIVENDQPLGGRSMSIANNDVVQRQESQESQESEGKGNGLQGVQGNGTEQTFPWTLRRLRAIQSIRPVSTYLEIGLGDGKNFNAVSAERKFGVDPHPWDPNILNVAGVFAETSDSFFAHHAAEALDRLDLVYVDGMHTAEQTYRDLMNTLNYAHPNTVWLIDDVMPSDYFSSLPDQHGALQARKASTGSFDRAWHGDVYKVVWLISQFHPSIDFVTIVESGNPQLLAWYAERDWEPAPLSLQEISSLSFADVVLNVSDFRPCSEDDALKKLAEASRE